VQPFCASKYDDEHRYINFDCREKKHKNQGHQHCVSLGQVNTKMTRITAVKICRTSKEHNQQDFSRWWESRLWVNLAPVAFEGDGLCCMK
jgi:hypothetical protein